MNSRGGQKERAEPMRAIGFAGWSGAGKTTLIVRLIPELNRRGFSVSTVKHAHHDFDVDRPGKDSYAHRAAGAHEVLVVSANRLALMRELRGTPEPSVADLLRLVATDRYRLAIRDLGWNPAQPGARGTLLVPAKTMTDAARMMSPGLPVRVMMRAEMTREKTPTPTFMGMKARPVVMAL